jgi:hypothetical protein
MDFDAQLKALLDEITDAVASARAMRAAAEIDRATAEAMKQRAQGHLDRTEAERKAAIEDRAAAKAELEGAHELLAAAKRRAA